MAKEKKRCRWSQNQNDAYIDYHDVEWGVPTYDDQVLFEFLILEGAQAGLSWSTILNKREGYERCFANFNVDKVARFTDKRKEKILQDAGIVRNKLKVNATVNNAKLFIDVQKEFGSFSKYLWGFVDHKPTQNKWATQKQVPATSDVSDALSKDLKKRGFKFVGSTIMYAYMQAVGMVNDHETSCFRYSECKRLGKKRRV